jgi:uncharacterized membrane protein (DUF485 family)
VAKQLRDATMSTSDVNSAKPTLHQVEWDRIAASRQFQDLLAIKRLFIVPAFAFFLLYYFLLPVLVGYAPKLMGTRVFSTVTVGYLFALSQFLVGWLIAGLYLRASSKFDRLTRDILGEAQLRQGGR